MYTTYTAHTYVYTSIRFQDTNPDNVTMSTSIQDSSISKSSSKHYLSAMEATVGPALLQTILSSKILLVGAGGIGCELLKNMALCGFRQIEVVDLDTIDVSNLNRQLLFRRPHVGHPKCTTACEVARGMVPTKGPSTFPTTSSSSSNDANDQLTAPPVSYNAHHANVCDKSKFNIAFVEQFDLILNALDNVTARRVMNRLALAANKPLVEAGTTGYLGQVNVIHKASGTACYECQTQEAPKVYPICTIRSTPSMPVHTIVWAKELYKLLFGENAKESMLYEGDDDDDDNDQGDKGEKQDEDPASSPLEESTYMPAVLEFRTLLAEGSSSATDASSDAAVSKIRVAAAQILTAVSITEIQKQLDMDRYKTARKRPVVLDPVVIAQGADPAQTTPPTQRANYRSTHIWNPTDCVAEFVACLVEAADRLSSGLPVAPAFDKDDDMSMRFVTAASNLRSAIFSIEPLQSFYSAKGIAGNIIPAIATTNAIAAGLQILQVLQILKAFCENRAAAEKAAAAAALEEGDASTEAKDGTTTDAVTTTTLRDYCCYSNCLRNRTRNGLYLTATKLEAPNPNCFVCNKATLVVSLANISAWTFSHFIDTILKKELGFSEPFVLLDGDCIWEEGEDADIESFQVNAAKMLPALPCGGISDGTMVTVEDSSQDLTLEISIRQPAVWPKAASNKSSSTRTPGTTSQAADDAPEETKQEAMFKYHVGGNVPQAPAAPEGATAATATSSEAASANEDNNDDDDDVIMVTESNSKTEGDSAGNVKRSPIGDTASQEDEPAAKKPKTTHATTDSSDVIEID